MTALHRIPADGADAGHPPRYVYDDIGLADPDAVPIVAAVLNDGTVRTERRDAPTVDTFLRDPHRIERALRQMADELGIAEMMFPRPIMDRIRDRAADLREGRSVRRYRGAHRSGTYTVAELERYVEAGAEDARRHHRRSLRRPVEPMVYLGEKPMAIRFYGVVPGPPGEAANATLTIEGADDDGEMVLTIPALQGPPGAPIEDIDEANTGPLVWQPAIAMLGDMFEPWPSVEALGG